mmetsp:Transcript_45103/g.100902  ORF Transcript_45103/g.100902 Transcript_45103/m.100902 type:complete len:250 (-) Transcript_45103:560-1309(-)
MPTIVILPSVRVPVLSLQITDAEPSVSTAASFRTSTSWLTMSEQPMDREMVTHSGMPSGIAATARVTDTRIMYSQAALSGLEGSLRSVTQPMMKMPTQITMARIPIRAPSLLRFCCRGVWLPEVSGKQKQVVFWPPSSPEMSLAMRPIRVFMPVSVTRPRPRPLVMLQPEKAMVSGVSFSGTPSFFSFTLAVLATSSGSPVRAISLTLKSLASKRRRSAGTTSPVPNTTMSPQTTLGTGTWTSLPSRST